MPLKKVKVPKQKTILNQFDELPWYSKILAETVIDQVNPGKVFNAANTVSETRDTSKNVLRNIFNPALEVVKLGTGFKGDLIANTLQEGLNKLPKDKNNYQQNDNYTMNKKYSKGGWLDINDTNGQGPLRPNTIPMENANVLPQDIVNKSVVSTPIIKPTVVQQAKPKLTNFEQRINKPTEVIKNNDGTVSTHEMMSFEADGRYYAAPTVVKKDGKLVRLSEKDAQDYAFKNNEFKEFKTDKEAKEYANNGYKKGTPLETKQVPSKTKAALPNSIFTNSTLNNSLSSLEYNNKNTNTKTEVNKPELPFRNKEVFQNIINYEKKKKLEASKKVNKQSNSNELLELLASDISVQQKANTVINGVKKNLIQEPAANIESWLDELTDDGKVKYPDAKISNLKRDLAIEKTKILKDQMYKQIKINETDKYFKDLPAIEHDNQYNIDKLKFGHRNKKENSDVNTSGVILQTLNPIITDKSKLENFQKNQQVIMLNKKTGKIELPKSIDDVPEGYAFTTANRYEVTDFDSSKKIKDTKNGTGTWFPTVITKDGKRIEYAVGASLNDNNRNDGLYGGKLFLISQDGKHKQLFVGSVAKLEKDFYKFKQKTNSNSVSIIQLDQGSYNKVNIPKNNKMTKKDWENYDAKNTKGGHAFYIFN